MQSAAGIKARILEQFLPAHCILCGLAAPLRLICEGCESDLPRIKTACVACALPGNWGDAGLCANCIRKRPGWDFAVAALSYEYPIEHVVRRFKFNGDMACGQLLAVELVRAVSTQQSQRSAKGPDPAPDLIVPVPLHFTRRFRRGFNQSEFLARALHRHLKIPLGFGQLRRVRSTAAQSGLHRKDRRKNLLHAFRAGEVRGKQVALVDDVMTTGSTLHECSVTLLRAGAAGITVWVAARVPTPHH